MFFIIVILFIEVIFIRIICVKGISCVGNLGGIFFGVNGIFRGKLCGGRGQVGAGWRDWG